MAEPQPKAMMNRRATNSSKKVRSEFLRYCISAAHAESNNSPERGKLAKLCTRINVAKRDAQSVKVRLDLLYQLIQVAELPKTKAVQVRLNKWMRKGKTALETAKDSATCTSSARSEVAAGFT